MLDAARQQGDSEADREVAALGPRIWAINALLAPLATHDDPLPEAIPESLGALVLPPLPAWADRHRLRAAQAFADRHLSLITVALFCAALPASYGDAEGARLLASTGRMHRDLDRRVNETARFVFDVLRPNAFDRGGRARLAAGRVRLVHAAVRASLPRRDELPINQEQMLGTLCLFSVVVLDALERLGVRIHPREADDYMHLWCVVGALLGIVPELLPADRAAATKLFAAIRARRFAPTEEGRALMGDLLAGMERHIPLRGAPCQLVHRLLGADAAGALGVPALAADSRWLGALLGAAPSFGRTLLEAVNAFKLRGARVTFPMPAQNGASLTSNMSGPPAL